MPKVSIITAIYNHEKYLDQTIQSVLSQTYSDWELILWDDGSTDSSATIAKRYAEKNPGRIHFYTHDGGKNLGQETTRNRAIEKAQGEYLCLLDSDDFYEPKKLELLVPLLDANPKVGLAYGRCAIFKEAEGVAVPDPYSVRPEGFVVEALLRENFVGASANIFRKACLNSETFFDSRYKTCGEYPLWLRIALDWKFAKTDEQVSFWRYHASNTGKKYALTAKFEFVRLFESLQKDPAFAEHHTLIHSLLAKKQYNLADALLLEGSLPDARKNALGVLSAKNSGLKLRAKSLLITTLSVSRRASAIYSHAKANRAKKRYL